MPPAKSQEPPLMIDALRDWGHARDYVRMQWLMLQQDQAEDFVITTGHQAPALPPGQAVVRIDPRCFRPTEVDTLLGDPTKAQQRLGWVPEIAAHQMCQEMVASDLQEAKRHSLLKANGYGVPVSAE